MKKYIYIICLILLKSNTVNAQESEINIDITNKTKVKLNFGSDIIKTTWIKCKEDEPFVKEIKTKKPVLTIYTNQNSDKELGPCKLLIALDDGTKLKINIKYKPNEEVQTEYNLKNTKLINALIDNQKDDEKDNEKSDANSDNSNANDKNTKKIVSEEKDDDTNDVVDVTKGKAREKTDEDTKNINSILEDGRLNDRINKLIQNFYTYCNRIANGKDFEINKKAAILNVFNNDKEATVQTFSEKSGLKVYKIEKYLDNVNLLPSKYKNSKYEPKNIRIISKPRYNADENKWFVAVSYAQIFEGKLGGKENKSGGYRDVTQKVVEVEIAMEKRLGQNGMENTWRVYISNITANKI